MTAGILAVLSLLAGERRESPGLAAPVMDEAAKIGRMLTDDSPRSGCGSVTGSLSAPAAEADGSPGTATICTGAWASVPEPGLSGPDEASHFKKLADMVGTGR
jgi:hypothetical protein